MSDIPAILPAGLESYSRTPEFTGDTVPVKLTEYHTTKAGVWGVIHVMEGALSYRLEPPREGEMVASAGESIIIEPTVAHRVAFVETGRFYVEFFRAHS